MNWTVVLDPGTQATGVAIWKTEDFIRGNSKAPAPPPFNTRLWTAPAARPWFSRACEMSEQLRSYLDGVLALHDRVEEVACELPMFFNDADGAQVATTGALVKLTLLVGMFAEVAESRHIPFFPIAVRDWKGQTPKPIVNRRIRKLLGDEACKHFRADIWDAVGIGLWMRGYLHAS